MRRAVVAAAALIAGCTVLEPYRAPGEGPRAGLRVFGNALGGAVTVVLLDAPGCGDGGGRLVGRLAQRQPADLRAIYLADGSPAPAPAADASVPAGRPLHLLVQAQGMLDGWYGYGCARALSFVPEAGARYDAVYVSEDPYRCRIDLWRHEAEGRARPEGATLHEPHCPLRAFGVRAWRQGTWQDT